MASERLVRSFKRVLYTILGTRRLKDEVLNTTYYKVEYALNPRPLAPVSADPSNLGAKSTNHFLLGYQKTGFPSIVGFDDFDLHERYACAKSCAKANRSRWLCNCSELLI